MEDIAQALTQGMAPEEAVQRALLLSRQEQGDLVRAVAALPGQGAASFLTLFYEGLSDPKLQKLVKKALFRLKTLGIPVEEPRAPGQSVLKKVETSREVRAFLSNYDAELTRVVLAAFEVKKRHFVFTHAVLHFSRGLLELPGFNVDKAGLDELLADYAARTRRPMVLAPLSPSYAGYLIEEASSISGNEAGEARSLHHVLSSVKDELKDPAGIYLLPSEGSGPPESPEAVLGRDLFEPFTLRWTGMEEDRKGLESAVNPGIVLPSYVVEERREAFLADLAQKERLSSLRPFFTRMLEDYAYLFHALGDLGAFTGLIALLRDAQALEKAFLRFVRKAFEGLEEKARQEPGVIVDPRSLLKR